MTFSLILYIHNEEYSDIKDSDNRTILKDRADKIAINSRYSKFVLAGMLCKCFDKKSGSRAGAKVNGKKGLTGELQKSVVNNLKKNPKNARFNGNI